MANPVDIYDDNSFSRSLEAIQLCRKSLESPERPAPIMSDGTPALEVVTPLGKRVGELTMEDLRKLQQLFRTRANTSVASALNLN